MESVSDWPPQHNRLPARRCRSRPGKESIGRFLEQGGVTGWIEFGPGPSPRHPIRTAIAVALIIVILAAVAHGQSIEELHHGEQP